MPSSPSPSSPRSTPHNERSLSVYPNTRPVSEVHRVGSSDIRRSRFHGTFFHMKYEEKEKEKEKKPKISGMEGGKGNKRWAGWDGWPPSPLTSRPVPPTHFLSPTHTLFRFLQGTRHVARVSAMFFGGVVPHGHSAFSPLLIISASAETKHGKQTRESFSERKGRQAAVVRSSKPGNELNPLGHLPLRQWPIGRGTR